MVYSRLSKQAKQQISFSWAQWFQTVHRWCATLKSRVMSDYVLENNRDQCLRRGNFLIAAPIQPDRRQFATNLYQRRPFLCKTISGGCSSGRRSFQSVLEEFRFRGI